MLMDFVGVRVTIDAGAFCGAVDVGGAVSQCAVRVVGAGCGQGSCSAVVVWVVGVASRRCAVWRCSGVASVCVAGGWRVCGRRGGGGFLWGEVREGGGFLPSPGWCVSDAGG